MNPYQLIDKLCHITSMLSDICQKQQAIIMQHNIEVDDAALSELISETDSDMDLIESELKRI